uniref:DUF6857 domain-containing protein n=1 Tax=Tetradesmus obliquus TaxID=3088 RepID=A0A383W133_TETOB|eukprot:jgi/Sobl393_1/2147/SZX70376.1
MDAHGQTRRTRRRWFEPASSDAGTATPALPVSSPAKHASDNSSLNSFWVGQQPPAPWPMPPAQPAEQQNSQPSAAQNPRHARQASVRHSAAGVLTTRSTNSSSNINKRGRSISTRQPLGATQAHVCDERRRDAERPGRVADLKPQPPAAARSHANKSRPAKASATDAASKLDTVRQQSDQQPSKEACKEEPGVADQLPHVGMQAPPRYCSHTAASMARASSSAPGASSAGTVPTKQLPAGVSRPRAPPARPLSCSSTAAGGRASHGRAAVLRSTRITSAGARAPCAGAEAGGNSSKLHSLHALHSLTPERSTFRQPLFSPDCSSSSQKQQYVAALKLLRRQQHQEQQQEPQHAQPAVDSSCSSRCSSNTQEFRQAQRRAAAAAAAALEEVLLLDRAAEFADQFHELQQQAATASPDQQVACVDAFTALSSSLQQLMVKQQQLWQQQHQQQQPEQRSTPSRAPSAGAVQAASPLWCSVTTNALFDSTPASAVAAAAPWSPATSTAAAGSSRLSPLKVAKEAAAAGAGACSTDDYQGLAVDFQPLRASLGAVRASQQHRLAASPASLQAAHAQQQQQQCTASQLLRQLQEEMQQWFVAYVDEQLCKAQAPVSTRGDCVELLKALTHAQQWIQQQQAPATAAAGTGSGQLLVSAIAEVAGAPPCSLQDGGAVSRSNGSSAAAICSAGGASERSGVAAAAGHTTPPPAAAAGSLSPAAWQHSKSPGSQLQQLQVSLRKSLCHLGFLRFQLPS